MLPIILTTPFPSTQGYFEANPSISSFQIVPVTLSLISGGSQIGTISEEAHTASFSRLRILLQVSLDLALLLYTGDVPAHVQNEAVCGYSLQHCWG